LAFDIEWWWDFQDSIDDQFGFSRIREDVATRFASRIFTQKGDISVHVKDRDLAIVGAGINSFTDIPESDLLVADGALRACLERGTIPEFIVTDFDGYISDLIWASEHGSKVIVHTHGDNLAAMYRYSSYIRPICVTSTYPSAGTSCWGGFTDGDRALMMALSLGCKSVQLVGFDFSKIGDYSGKYSPRKLEKLAWAKKIVTECMQRSNSVSFA
jgi:uncharacterized Rossmann fold enzyme